MVRSITSLSIILGLDSELLNQDSNRSVGVGYILEGPSVLDQSIAFCLCLLHRKKVLHHEVVILYTVEVI